MSNDNSYSPRSPKSGMVIGNDEWYGILGGAFSSVLFGVLFGILAAIGFIALHQI